MSNPIDTRALAQEMLSAYTTGTVVAVPPSARHQNFDLKSAFEVEAEFSRLRQEAGRKITGWKVGYANKAMWRILKLETLVWAHMYDDTVHYAGGNRATLALSHIRSPKIEPEIVFRLKKPVPSAGLDAAAVLESVDWLAVGFELIDCPFPDWQLKPVDFVAGFGLHLGLVVGQPLQVEAGMIPALASGLSSFKVRVTRDGQFVEEGSGKNSLRSPALCLAEMAGAIVRLSPLDSLAAGQLISTGTLTAGHPITRGETWQVEVDGLPLEGFTLVLS
jgi:2-oxo-3-hexenedioate decarboxylase